MRDRLIKILSAFPVWGKTLKDQWFDKAIERLADHLLANGVIVPPAMVGDKCYRIYWDFRIDVCKVSAITIKADKSFKIRITSGINRSVFEITPDKIGKNVFLTKEEAEKALERSEDEE